MRLAFVCLYFWFIKDWEILSHDLTVKILQKTGCIHFFDVGLCSFQVMVRGSIHRCEYTARLLLLILTPHACRASERSPQAGHGRSRTVGAMGLSLLLLLDLRWGGHYMCFIYFLARVLTFAGAGTWLSRCVRKHFLEALSWLQFLRLQGCWIWGLVLLLRRGGLIASHSVVEILLDWRWWLSFVCRRWHRRSRWVFKDFDRTHLKGLPLKSESAQILSLNYGTNLGFLNRLIFEWINGAPRRAVLILIIKVSLLYR